MSDSTANELLFINLAALLYLSKKKITLDEAIHINIGLHKSDIHYINIVKTRLWPHLLATPKLNYKKSDSKKVKCIKMHQD